MKSRFWRFLVGFLASATAFACANRMPEPSRGQDVIKHLGVPFVYQRWGGIHYIEEFHPAVLFADIAVGLIVSLLLGYACSLNSPTRAT